MKVLTIEKFIAIAEMRGRDVRPARMLLTCGLCKGKGTGQPGVRCVGCDDMKQAVWVMPVLVDQHMPAEDFEKLREAIRKGESRYG